VSSLPETGETGIADSPPHGDAGSPYDEAHFQLLAEAIPQIVWTARPDGWLDYYNGRWYEYTGMTLAQTQGWGWQPVLHPDDVRRCLDYWQEAVTTGQPYEVEYRFKRASDGCYRWHLGRALPVRDSSGHIVKWFGTCTDIDDQKQATEALRARATASEAQMQVVLESMACGVLVLDAAGEVTLINAAAEEMLGLPFAEVRRLFAQRGHLVALQREDGSPMPAEEIPSLRVLTTRERVHGAVMGMTRLDGQQRWVQLDAVPVLAADGSVAHVVVSFVDISQRRQAEAALRDSDAPVVLSALDRHGVYTLSEGKGLSALGLRAGERVGHSLFDFYPDGTEVAKGARAALAGSPWAMVARVRGRVLESTWTPVRDELGEVSGAIAVSSDVTDRAEAEEALQASEERLQIVVDHAPVILFSLDRQGVYTLAAGHVGRSDGSGCRHWRPVDRR